MAPSSNASVKHYTPKGANVIYIPFIFFKKEGRVKLKTTMAQTIVM